MSAEELLDLPRETRSRRTALWAWAYGRFCRRLAFGSLLLRFGDSGARLFQGPFAGGTVEIRIERPLRFLLRLLARGEIGFAESYMEGDWSTTDLPGLLDLLNLNAEHLSTAVEGPAWSRRLDRLVHRLRDNHRRNSRRNIARHYDLGNDFYRLWLDPGMTYSSAVFKDPAREPLESAQARKYERLLDWLDARPGESLLEIGCGWGGFAEAAARRGLRVTGVTLSREQLAHAQARIAAAGLAERVDLRLQDYRDIAGSFDHAVSIEMLEAVGEAYWTTYFQQLRRLVRPGGRIAIQVITLHEDDFPRYRRCADFIQLYIFPGGMLPSPDRLETEVRAAGLIPLASRWHGSDYGETLRRWRRAFLAAEEPVARLGYGARFRRMWDYYLAYCEAGFDSGTIDLAQVLLQVPGDGTVAARAGRASVGASVSGSGPDAPLQGDLGQPVQGLHQGGGAQIRAQAGVGTAPREGPPAADDAVGRAEEPSPEAPVDLVEGPTMVLDVLHPLVVADGDPARVGEDVRQYQHPLSAQ